jgi:hypothetical protein
MRARSFALALVLLASCNKDPPPKPAKEEPKTSPVPSDMVFNDFIPSAGNPTNLSVRVDGGLLEGGALAGNVDPGQPEASNGKFRVTEPGAEPRALRKYTFVPNKVDKRVLTMRQQVGTPQGPKEIALAFTVEFTPKQVTPKSTKFELKIVKVDIPDVSAAEKAQAAQQFGVFNGMTATFEVSPQGEIGEIEFHGDERMQSPQVARMAQAIVSGLQQFVELIIPPFPTTPIGVGAKWESSEERNESGLKMTSTRKLFLKDATNDGGTVTTEVSIKVPKTAIPARPGGPQGTLEIDAKGQYTYAFKFDHVSTRVEGELVTKQAADIKGQPPVNETTKAKHLMEVAK